MNVEAYKILMRQGFSQQAGMDRSGRKITKYVETYTTSVGKMSPEEWKSGLMAAVDQEGEGELLELIRKHCREECAWLHTEEAVLEYSLEILAGRYFLCGSDAWNDVETEARGRGLVKESMSYAEHQRSHRYQPPRKAGAGKPVIVLTQEEGGQMRFG